MRKTRQSVTIQDVAKAAGVSVSTVSRVLNGKVDVASETQDRIRSVIDDLGFTTNLAARSMRSHKKNLVGLIMPDIAYPFAIEVMKGVNRAIAESEFDLLVYTTGDVRKSGRAFHEQKYVSLLTNSISDVIPITQPCMPRTTRGRWMPWSIYLGWGTSALDLLADAQNWKAPVVA